jgi:nucleotide-binding universal stress UspA family protein
MDALMQELRQRIKEDTYDWLKPVTYLPKGPAVTEAPELANRIGAEVAVLGTLARSGLTGLLVGNTAEAVLHRLDCSVLALKPLDFISPVRPERFPQAPAR